MNTILRVSTYINVTNRQGKYKYWCVITTTLAWRTHGFGAPLQLENNLVTASPFLQHSFPALPRHALLTWNNDGTFVLFFHCGFFSMTCVQQASIFKSDGAVGEGLVCASWAHSSKSNLFSCRHFKVTKRLFSSEGLLHLLLFMRTCSAAPFEHRFFLFTHLSIHCSGLYYFNHNTRTAM